MEITEQLIAAIVSVLFNFLLIVLMIVCILRTFPQI